jgi:hypothetical protein
LNQLKVTVMRQNSTVILAAMMIAARALPAQDVAAGTDPLSFTRSGLHLYNVTLSSGYYSGPYPSLGLAPIVPGPAGTQSVALQASATIGWLKTGRKTSFSLVYSPAFFSSVYFTSFRSFDQSLAVSVTRALSPKWSIQGSTSALMSDFNQLLFAPTTYGSITGTAATFDQFSSAILTGRSDNAALTQLLAAAPVVSSPENAFAYGGRVFSASARVSATYAASTRSSYTASASGSYTQFLTAGSSAPNVTPTYRIPSTKTTAADLSWAYLLTPRTTLTVSGSVYRTASQVQDVYVSQGNVSMGRTLSRRWFVQGMLGFGYISPQRQTNSIQSQQREYGGSVGYKLYAHTFLGSYTRSASDIYGLGANATDNAEGAWTWNVPGRSTTASASFGYARLIGPNFPNWTSWTTRASVARYLGNSFAVVLGYTYGRYPQVASLVSGSQAQTGVMLSVTWSPYGRAHGETGMQHN